MESHTCEPAAGWQENSVASFCCYPAPQYCTLLGLLPHSCLSCDRILESVVCEAPGVGI